MIYHFFKKNETKFDTIISKDLGKYKTYDPSYSMDSIGSIKKLNNGTIMTFTFSGFIQIWNPISGQCIKEIRELEVEFKKKKFLQPQDITVYQLSDEMIILEHRGFHLSLIFDVYALLINPKIILQKIFSEVRIRSILPISSNKMIIAYSSGDWKTGSIELYKIENINNKIILTESHFMKLKIVKKLQESVRKIKRNTQKKSFPAPQPNFS